MADGLATAFARVVVDELVGRGVTDLVLAPGSRSAVPASRRWRRPTGSAGCGSRVARRAQAAPRPGPGQGV